MLAGTVNSSATMRFPSATVIDELGFEPMNRQEASQFFRLVTYRYGRGSILITSNKSVREWTELLAGDEVLATAILEGLLHKTPVLNIKTGATGCATSNNRWACNGNDPSPNRDLVKLGVVLTRKTGCRLTPVGSC
jgi:DNA replication protein DnaC